MSISVSVLAVRESGYEWTPSAKLDLHSQWSYKRVELSPRNLPVI